MIHHVQHDGRRDEQHRETLTRQVEAFQHQASKPKITDQADQKNSQEYHPDQAVLFPEHTRQERNENFRPGGHMVVNERMMSRVGAR